MKKLLCISALALFILSFGACKKSDRSSVTGWKYNDQEWGGFEFHGDMRLAWPGPIEGGTFTMDSPTGCNLEWVNVPREYSFLPDG
jgi:hypothetical protein